MVAWIGLGAGGAAVLLAAGVYLALRRVPPFYSRALAQNAVEAEQASQEMGSRATALLSRVRMEGSWQALFTDAQINGWLAVELAANHRALLSDEIREPRVAIRANRLLIGFRRETNGVSAVGSIELGITLVEANVVACRVVGVRAGSLPLPLGHVLDTLHRSAARLDIPVRWAQSDGDPVALLILPSGREPGDPAIRLERLELEDGRIYLAGRTRRGGGPTDGAPLPPVQSGVAGRDPVKVKHQRF